MRFLLTTWPLRTCLPHTKRIALSHRSGRPQINHAYFTSPNRDITAYPDDDFKAFAAMDTSHFKADKDVWYLDTGATHHMTFQKDWLINYRQLQRQITVHLGDDSTLYAQGVGSLKVTLPSGRTALINNIYHLPGLARNLLSLKLQMMGRA